jgi:hypothetical protein
MRSENFLKSLALATVICAGLYYILRNKNEVHVAELNASIGILGPDGKQKEAWETIYKPRKLEDDSIGGGSGYGSSVAYTKNCRDILYSFIKKYNIKSLLDSPCGSFNWMQLSMRNITAEIPDFQYQGVDVVEPLINKLQVKFASLQPNIKFNLLDITQQPLPDGYDVIFSRDAMMHLPLIKTIQFLENIARTKSKYFLTQSFIDRKEPNKNVPIAGYFYVDLTKEPFNVREYIERYREKDWEDKQLVLYDIERHIKTIDFAAMRERAKAFIK